MKNNEAVEVQDYLDIVIASQQLTVYVAVRLTPTHYSISRKNSGDIT
ncbi:MAG: hypothetical protein WCP96_00280 [Methylococcaceae bacterium]